ncbi:MULTISPECIES: GntR family transcriptional regulator [Clostridium]|uniref:GntR family transcriptional regulator n=1 Tax=Clostridium disporicum TaxID=84024 RepID=A0A174BK24_9CLOT|nr:MULTISPECIES: GntR family transcriptional regulator [Clostridium]MCD2500800.1 GntR family transcriptional regulator [Clostridium sp. NSJ-145]CUO01362.1 GntR family transcriptional regulator [Clostridium disporicum]
MKSKDILKDLIESIVCGELEVNSKFPSESNLAQKYECNRHTIRKVMDVLIERGYARKSHGGPTFVNELPCTYSLNLSSQYDLYSAKDIHTKVLNLKQIVADDNICEKLQIDKGSKVWYITRLRCINTKIDHIEYIYMPISLFPNLTKQNCEASLLSYIEYDNDYEISHGIKNISAVILTNEEMELSNKQDSNLAIQVENIGYLTNGRVYEYSINKHFNNSIVYYAKR